MFFLFLTCECLDLSRRKMVSLQYTLLKGTSHFSLKNMFLLENFPNRCISSRFYLFFAFCPLLQVLPSWDSPSNPSSLFKILLLFLTVKRAKSPLGFAGSCSGLSSNPNPALLWALFQSKPCPALGSLPIQTLPCSRICWTPPSSTKHPLIFQSDINLSTLWTIIVLTLCTTELFSFHILRYSCEYLFSYLPNKIVNLLHTERAQQFWSAEMQRQQSTLERIWALEPATSDF